MALNLPRYSTATMTESQASRMHLAQGFLVGRLRCLMSLCSGHGPGPLLPRVKGEGGACPTNGAQHGLGNSELWWNQSTFLLVLQRKTECMYVMNIHYSYNHSYNIPLGINLKGGGA